MKYALTEAKMERSTRRLLATGAGLTILGCFIPWYGEGDVVFYRQPGIAVGQQVSINPLKRLPPLDVVDNGGMLIVILACAVLWLAYHPPRFLGEPLRWFPILIIGQIALALYHLIRLSALADPTVIGGLVLLRGLYVVL